MLVMAKNRAVPVTQADALRVQLGMSYRRLARAIGLEDESVLRRVLSGKTRNPHPHNQSVYDRAYAFLKQQVKDAPPPVVGKPLIPVGYSPLPIRYAGVVPAGDWGDPLESEDFIEVDPALVKNNRYACTVQGLSCSPALHPNDITIWEQDMNPSYGLIVLAQRKGDHACTVKVLEWDAAQNRPVLMPLNPNYEPPEDFDGWGVIARLVAVIRHQDGPERRWVYNSGLRPRHLL